MYIRLKAKHFADSINEVGFNPFITPVFGAQKPSGHLNRHSNIGTVGSQILIQTRTDVNATVLTLSNGWYAHR